MTSLQVLAFLAFHVGTLNGKPAAEPKYPVSRSRGHLVKEDPMTGEHRRLDRHGLQGLDKKENHHLRVNFDDDQMLPLTMQVSHGSVWTKHSTMVVQRRRHRVLVPQSADEDCFLHGLLVDSDGTVSINTCGKMTVDIHTPEHHYHLEEHKTHKGETNQSHTTFEVAQTRHERSAFEEKYDQVAMDLVQRKAEEILEEEPADNNGTLRTKRDVPSVTVEVAVHLDANYATHLYFDKNLDTEDKIRRFIINKWNLVQGVYGRPKKVGAQMTIALSLIEIWWDNPEGYLGDEVSVSQRLRWFCRNTPESNDYDLKVIYTKYIGPIQLQGLAYTGNICTENFKCMLVKGSTETARIEVHEMGHTLGFNHDPMIGDCEAEGFMGWSAAIVRYLPCYRRVLRRNLRDDTFRCLFQQNVSSDNNQVNPQ